MGFHWETDTPEDPAEKKKVADPAEKKKVDVHPVVTPEVPEKNVKK